MVISPRLLLLTGFIIYACKPDQSVDMSSFKIHEDFDIALVAMEPLVTDPVDMEFDEHGRAYVIEMPSYPEFQEQNRIIILDDEDGDGRFDKRTLFADNLGVSSSLLPYQGGILVANPPHLTFLKDTDGDDRADLRNNIMSGFSYGNTQHNFNGLTYGIDNWIYMANGGNSGEVYWAGDSLNKIPLRGQDFRIDIENKKFELIGDSSGGFELAMDQWGNIFETHNLEHISHLEFNEQYLERIQILGKSAREQISDHDVDGLARIYPIGLQETRVNHPEQSGYFSGACGITYYGGGLWNQSKGQSILVADVVLNLIHRDFITPKGSSFKASRDGLGSDFLACSDRSFRPVNMTVGPDGSLFVLDMHRDVIEHPEWIPDEIEADLDLNAGRDQGRIYRIIPKQFQGHASTTFDTSEPRNMIHLLEHPHQWHRLTAQRLLMEFGDKTLKEDLEYIVNSSNSAVAYLHALYTLHGLGLLTEKTLLPAFEYGHEEVRVHALRLAEHYTESAAVWNKMLSLTQDPHTKVRRQLALTLSKNDLLENTQVVKALIDVLRTNFDDSWTHLAVLGAAPGKTDLLMDYLLESESSIPLPDSWYSDLTSLAVMENPEIITPLLTSLSQEKHPSTRVTAMINGMLSSGSLGSLRLSTNQRQQISGSLDGLETNDLPKIQACWDLRSELNLEPSKSRQLIIEEALTMLEDRKLNPDLRVQALELIASQNIHKKEQVLLSLLNIKETKSVQLAAIKALGEDTPAAVVDTLISQWDQLGPQVRVEVSNILIYQPRHHLRLLSAIENGQLSMGELNLHLERRRELLFADDPQVRSRAQQLFTDAGVVTRKEALNQFRAAIDIKGVAAQGKEHYETLCSNCHIKGNLGVSVGPNLSEIHRKSAETLMHDIIDPNAAVETAYINHQITTVDGEVHSGMVIRETEQVVVIRNLGAQDISIERQNIAELTSTGKSLMPEGLESSLDPQKMADLLAYLQQYD